MDRNIFLLFIVILLVLMGNMLRVKLISRITLLILMESWWFFLVNCEVAMAKARVYYCTYLFCDFTVFEGNLPMQKLRNLFIWSHCERSIGLDFGQYPIYSFQKDCKFKYMSLIDDCKQCILAENGTMHMISQEMVMSCHTYIGCQFNAITYKLS